MTDWAFQIWATLATAPAYIFDISPQAKSALLGAAVGSILGGVINYVLARRATRIDAAKRMEDKKDSRKGKVMSLMIKLIRINTFAKGISQHLDECRARHDPPALSHQTVTPIANLPPSFFFDPEELVALIALKNDRLLNQVLHLEGLYNTALEGMRLYQQTRKEASLATPAAVEGRIVSFDLTREEYQKLMPQIIDMESILEDLDPCVVSLWAVCQRALPQLVEELNKQFGLNMRLSQPVG